MLNPTFIDTNICLARGRRAPLPGTLWLSLLVTATSACIFTSPINSPPTIKIVPPPAGIFRNQPATFTAEVTDDQADTTIRWGVTTVPCPSTTTDPTLWPPSWETQPAFTVDAPLTRAPFCVWAMAVDHYGAQTPAHYSAEPTDRAPTAKIVVVTPMADDEGSYSFLSQFQLSGALSTDPEKDELSMKWSLVSQPVGSQATLTPCPGVPKPDLRCLASDKSGEYRVELAVSDSVDRSTDPGSHDGVTLKVLEDKLPCIDQTMPDFAAGTTVRVLSPDDDPTAINTSDDFAVLRVADDLDPWPGNGDSQLRFSWSVGPEGSTQPMTPLAPGPKATIPATSFRIGDKIRIRVEIADRNNAGEIQKALIGCNDNDACAVNTNGRAFGNRAGCLLRVTWHVEYR